MGEYTIYLDVVFIINLLMDYLILWGTAKFTGFTTTYKKLLLSAFIGALYSLIIFMPNFHFLATFFIKLFFSAIMVFIAYYPLRWRKFLQALGYFYLVACAAGGSMLGAIYLLSNSEALSVVNGIIIGTFSIKYTFLLVAICSAIIIGLFGAKILRRNLLNNILQVPLIIRVGSQRFKVKALVDTGNSLKDPVSGIPVVVTELNVLKDLFPDDVYQKWNGEGEIDINNIFEKIGDTDLAHRIRAVPFSSVGKKKGLLIGIRPDEVIVVYQQTPIKVSKVIIGIYNKALSPEGCYKALLHPDLLQIALSA